MTGAVSSAQKVGDTMESVNCLFCREQHNDIAIAENGYSGRRCVNCGLIYISPRPSAAETTQIYTDHHAALYADAQLYFARYKEEEASETIRIIKNFRHNGTLLELGAGGGAFVSAARKRGFTPYAIELNPIEATWISRDLNIPCESVALNVKSFQGRKFDIVYHRDVLSHLYDPIETFQSINQSLEEKGLVVFETGNIADVHSRHLALFSQFLYPDHLYFFGEKSLRLLLERTGFECVRIYRTPIILHLLLQKALWGFKDRLKDGAPGTAVKQVRCRNDSTGIRVTAKRKVRLLYRYTSHYLEKAGGCLPKAGWPLKLLVVAEKRS